MFCVMLRLEVAVQPEALLTVTVQAPGAFTDKFALVLTMLVPFDQE